MTWTADIMTDPDREDQLHVELMEDDEYRARIIEEGGSLYLKFYSAPLSPIPVAWLLGITSRFSEDLAAIRVKLGK